MKRLFLTGSTGRLARHVVPLLLQRGYQIRALCHSASPPEWEGKVQMVRGGLTDQSILNDAVKGCHVILHLAAKMPPVSDDEMFRVNIEGTYRLLQAAVTAKEHTRIVFSSTDATYATGWSLSPYISPVDENTLQRPVLFYGISKVIGEQMCINYGDLHQIPVVRLRFPTIMEPLELSDFFVNGTYKDFLAAADQDKWNDKTNVKVVLHEDGRPFIDHVIDVRDAAQGVLLAIEKEAAVNQVFNIAGPSAFSYDEVGPQIADRLGVGFVKAHCKGLYNFELSIQKAKLILGYNPKYSVMKSFEDAFPKKLKLRNL